MTRQHLDGKCDFEKAHIAANDMYQSNIYIYEYCDTAKAGSDILTVNVGTFVEDTTKTVQSKYSDPSPITAVAFRDQSRKGRICKVWAR